MPQPRIPIPESRFPTITVVICARNAAAHLRRSVPASLAQDYPADRLRVLVVDNGSTDGTGEVAEQLGAVVRTLLKPGVAGARQFGWQQSESDLVAYLDADCEPPRDWLSRLAARFADPAVGAAGVRLVSPPPQTLAERHIIEAGILDTDFFWTRNALQWPFLVTAGIMVRRAALEQIGGFDLGFGRDSGEDADLCWRLERAGWRVEYCRDIEVVHHHRSTIPAMLRQIHWYGRSSAAVFAKWHTELGWRRYTDRGPYRRLARGLVRAPFAMLARRGYERWRPALEALDAGAFLIGKWRSAWDHQVMFF